MPLFNLLFFADRTTKKLTTKFQGRWLSLVVLGFSVNETCELCNSELIWPNTLHSIVACGGTLQVQWQTSGRGRVHKAEIHRSVSVVTMTLGVNMIFDYEPLLALQLLNMMLRTKLASWGDAASQGAVLHMPTVYLWGSHNTEKPQINFRCPLVFLQTRFQIYPISCFRSTLHQQCTQLTEYRTLESYQYMSNLWKWVQHQTSVCLYLGHWRSSSARCCSAQGVPTDESTTSHTSHAQGCSHTLRRDYSIANYVHQAVHPFISTQKECLLHTWALTVRHAMDMRKRWLPCMNKFRTK